MTVHREIREMEERGEVREVGREVRGGRPSPVYEYVRDYAARAYVRMQRRQGHTEVQMERWDMAGDVRACRTWNYASVEEESLDGRLDELVDGRRLLSIGVYCAPSERREGLRRHLWGRYGCAVEYLNAAKALAKKNERSVTIYLAQGEEPEGCIYRKGELCELGRLDLLSLPASWRGMDYTDHTMVEEMVARLLQALICVLMPTMVSVYADFWTTKLVSRIRFNTQSKLHGTAPPLYFETCAAQALCAALHRMGQTIGDSSE